MKYHGLHFKLARAAIGIKMDSICEEIRMSIVTIKKLERAVVIEYGSPRYGRPEKGRFAKDRVMALVEFYEQRGVVFLAATSKQGPGIRMKKEKYE